MLRQDRAKRKKLTAISASKAGVAGEEDKPVSRAALNKLMREQQKLNKQTEETRHERLARKFGCARTHTHARAHVHKLIHTRCVAFDCTVFRTVPL